MLWVTHCQRSEDPCIPASLFCQCIYHIMNEQLCRVLNLILENGWLEMHVTSVGKQLSINAAIEFTVVWTEYCTRTHQHSFPNLSWKSVFCYGYLSHCLRLCHAGWSVDLVMPRCASGTLIQVSVYTSSWATWRRCAASSMTGDGWSAVPTTSWWKFGTPRWRPASTRCKATQTECTHYRWGLLQH